MESQSESSIDGPGVALPGDRRASLRRYRPRTHGRVERMREASRELGPGLITGAADDDPSGIATYSQAGAAFGYGLLWTMLLTYPLMVAIQVISAQVGRVSGRGLATNLQRL